LTRVQAAAGRAPAPATLQRTDPRRRPLGRAPASAPHPRRTRAGQRGRRVLRHDVPAPAADDVPVAAAAAVDGDVRPARVRLPAARVRARAAARGACRAAPERRAPCARAAARRSALRAAARMPWPQAPASAWSTRAHNVLCLMQQGGERHAACRRAVLLVSGCTRGGSAPGSAALCGECPSGCCRRRETCVHLLWLGACADPEPVRLRRRAQRRARRR